MDMTQRVALAQRLEAVEVELQRAVRGQDGSLAARTRLARARAAYRETEQFALAVLAAWDELALAEVQQGDAYELDAPAAAG